MPAIPKEALPPLPIFSDGNPQEMSNEMAYRLLKARADTIFAWTDFGWSQVGKTKLLALLKAPTPTGEVVVVKKSPHFTTYFVSRP